jgi:Domain of unknown function (DUF4224)
MQDDLSPAELATITGKTRAAAQAAKLAKLGVPFIFLGRAVRVARTVAEAHALVAQSRAAGGVDFSRVK